jgi:hypothetical protein
MAPFCIWSDLFSGHFMPPENPLCHPVRLQKCLQKDLWISFEDCMGQYRKAEYSSPQHSSYEIRWKRMGIWNTNVLATRSGFVLNLGTSPEP